jgi:hypothetical protein
MSKSAQPTASPELIAVWLDRYRGLNSLIQTRSRDPSLWVWTVQHKILEYLLHRYGPQISARDLMGVSAELVKDKPPSTTQASSARAASPEGETEHPAPPRTASAFRSKLDRLSELNATRYAALAEEDRKLDAKEIAAATWPVIPLPYQDQGYFGLSDAILAEQRTLMFGELEAIAELIPEDHPLTEDEILAILSDNTG